MALINCPECGKEISDKALTCPNCGTPINMRMAIPVTFVRPKAFTGGMIKIFVYVDSQKEGALANGKSFDTELMTGRHIVEFDAGNTHTSAELIIPDDANECVVEVGAGMMGAKITAVKTK